MPAWNPMTPLDGESHPSFTVVDGTEVPVTLTRLYRCDGLNPLNDQPCNLVWERPAHAIACAEHGHRSSFKQAYGRSFYVRKAVRRDSARALTKPAGSLEPQVIRQAPTPEPLPQLSADPVAAAMAFLKSQGYRVSRAPQPKVTPEPEASELPF